MKIGKAALVTALVAIPAFLLAPMAPLGSLLWPPPAMELHPAPTAAQEMFFMLLGLITAIAFGLGVAFLLYGGNAVREVVGDRRGLGTLIHASVTWVLGNWWIHDSLHMVLGVNPAGLLTIEYAFHVTLMAAGGILAYGLITLGRTRRDSGAVGVSVPATAVGV